MEALHLQLLSVPVEKLPPDATAAHLEHWHALIRILLTPTGKTWRKSFNSNAYRL